MTLRIIEDGRPVDVPIRQGEVLMLPAHTRHSPQRPADTVGLVIERIRQPGELDAFEWYCEKMPHTGPPPGGRGHRSCQRSSAGI